MVGRAVVWAFGVRSLLLCPHTVIGSSTRGAKTETQALQVNSDQDRDRDNDHVNDGDENHGHDVQTPLLRHLHGDALRKRAPADAVKAESDGAARALFLEHHEARKGIRVSCEEDDDSQHRSVLTPSHEAAAASEEDDDYKNVHYEHDEWATPIENGAVACGGYTTLKNGLRCEKRVQSGHEWKIWHFGPGIFGINHQVLVPPYTILEGYADPYTKFEDPKELNFENDRTPDNEPHFGPNNFKPDATGSESKGQTLILARRTTPPEPAPDLGFCSATSGSELKRLRIGFVMSSHTVARMLNYQGLDTVRTAGNDPQCGGGIFETKGCGHTWCGDSSPGNADSDGKAVENVLIENIRINDVFSKEDHTRKQTFEEYGTHLLRRMFPGRDLSTVHKAPKVRSAQLVFWLPESRPDSEGGRQLHDYTRNIIVRNIIAYSTQSTGLEIHSRAENVLIDNVHIQNTGKDGLGVWGAGSSKNIVFKNCEIVNPGIMTFHWVGNCAGIMGAGGKVVFKGLRCVTPSYREFKEDVLTPTAPFWHYLFSASTMLRIIGEASAQADYHDAEIIVEHPGYELLQLNEASHQTPPDDLASLSGDGPFSCTRGRMRPAPEEPPRHLLWTKSDADEEGASAVPAPFCFDNFETELKFSISTFFPQIQPRSVTDVITELSSSKYEYAEFESIMTTSGGRRPPGVSRAITTMQDAAHSAMKEGLNAAFGKLVASYQNAGHTRETLNSRKDSQRHDVRVYFKTLGDEFFQAMGLDDWVSSVISQEAGRAPAP